MSYESLNFTGPHAEWTLLDPAGRSYRRDNLSEEAEDVNVQPGVHPGGPGRGKKGVVVNPGAYCACGEPIARVEVNKKYTRCRRCRAARRQGKEPSQHGETR
jgi:hypothetical protein